MNDPNSDFRMAVWITSKPWRDVEGRARTATLLLYSSPGLHVVLLKTGEPQPAGDVTWRVDERAEVFEFWTTPPWAQMGDLVPFAAVELMRQMKGASSLFIKTAATPELVFPLEGALEASVQANLDSCGAEG